MYPSTNRLDNPTYLLVSMMTAIDVGHPGLKLPFEERNQLRTRHMAPRHMAPQYVAPQYMGVPSRPSTKSPTSSGIVIARKGSLARAVRTAATMAGPHDTLEFISSDLKEPCFIRAQTTSFSLLKDQRRIQPLSWLPNDSRK